MSYALSPAARNQIVFWSGAALLFLLFLYVCRGFLPPFVLGLLIAYLLDPVVRRLTQVQVRGRHIPRGVAALIILCGFFTVLGIIAAMALPLAYRELAQLAHALPGYADKVWTMVSPYASWAQERLGHGDGAALQQGLQGNIGKIMSAGGGVLAGIASGGAAVAGFLTVFVLTPIVAYYMMKEWPAMKDWIDRLLPRKHYETIRGLLRQIDRKVAGFIRGQLTVAAILAAVYAVALSLAGLDYGFLIGLMAGMLSIIPLVGSTVGLLVAAVVAWFQAGTWTYTVLIAAIFLIGQFIEGNFLSPKLLGDSVGLHPLWIMFALLAGGALLGIAGMLLAVPVAAIIGVLAGFAITLYKNSAYYNEDAAKKNKSAPQ